MKFTIEDNIKKFYPTVEESRINNKLKCTEEGCNSVFVSESNLNLHLVKTHNRTNLKSDTCQKQYFCPELGCPYHTKKYFRKLKILRTHYTMTHSPEQFECSTCDKVFPLEKVLSRHVEYCGVNFVCHQCSAHYATYEALQTHGRRKKHIIPEKTFYKLNNKEYEVKSDTVVQSSAVPILPKNAVGFILVVDSITKFSRESQTYAEVPKFESKMVQVSSRLEGQNNQQTQTGTKNQLSTVQTQTIGGYNHRKSSAISDNPSTQKTSNTQTDIVESKNSSCNTSYNKDEFLTKNSVHMNSSSTQTGECLSSYTASTHTHDSIYTNTSDLLKEDMNDNIGSFEFDNCHMETQTDFILDDVMFNGDYMTNMYTQTCDDILNDLGFSNIQTQTAIDDILKSVESQTVMSRTTAGERDMTHMETQTDVIFREMLEVINS
ncbi:uncharacterized protein LOC114335429 [Diabrotica virgifera virgifera]|uniref:Uncharacterized protein LOC114335429 n=1 Tax=Diabrotica virgifera virgifera TaxID=50390 RepID=A0A6P7FY15_DIAVI|nr:uncharacterized protein LOC114335429 [Diabrotica virgifera virgifera]